MQATSNRILSHEVDPVSLATAIQQTKQRVRVAGEKPYVTVERQLQLVDELARFPFGQFLLQHQGWNGYWTHYAVTHPWQRRETGLDLQGQPFTPLEKIILDQAPTVLATQQRFRHFLRENQKAIKNGAKLACVPAGLLGELLYLDYSGVSSIELYGIDNDPVTLQAAQQLAKEKNLDQWTTLLVKDAWQLNIYEKFDLISSNGLNIYEPSVDRVTKLYKEFYSALCSGGVLVTSFLTFPPNYPDKCEWDMSKVDPEAALLQKIIFLDVLNFKSQGFCTSEQTEQQLTAAGFQDIQFFYDEAKIFPTVVARK